MTQADIQRNDEYQRKLEDKLKELAQNPLDGNSIKPCADFFCESIFETGRKRRAEVPS